jgi:DNA-binding CsgD family transcriptional regulator
MDVQEPPGRLAVLGLSARDEQLYRLLLRHPGQRADRLAELAGLPEPELRELVGRLVAAGVVEPPAEDGAVLARPPDEALSRLINEESRRLQVRADHLEAARGLLPSLTAEHLAATMPRGEPVTLEMVQGGDVLQLVRSLSANSTGDLLWLWPDQWTESWSEDVDAWIRDVTRAGRRSRAIYPARALQETPDVIRARAEAGEHVRILAEVPFRLVVMGRSVAATAQSDDVAEDRRLVIRQPALVQALRLLFEGLWDKAMAVPGLDGQRYDRGTRGQRLLLNQLAGGAKDEQIARALGISLRTVRRRVADLLDDLGAQSRFQAGVEAVRRGWI